jgi:hypothetical protein
LAGGPEASIHTGAHPSGATGLAQTRVGQDPGTDRGGAGVPDLRGLLPGTVGVGSHLCLLAHPGSRNRGDVTHGRQADERASGPRAGPPQGPGRHRGALTGGYSRGERRRLLAAMAALPAGWRRGPRAQPAVHPTAPIAWLRLPLQPDGRCLAAHALAGYRATAWPLGLWRPANAARHPKQAIDDALPPAMSPAW